MDNEITKKLLSNLKKDKRFTARVGTEISSVSAMPSGILEFDEVVTGIGGIPRGKITQIWGPYESGKSTLAGQIAATMQSRNDNPYGGTVALIDTESKFCPEWWEAWGVDMGRLIIPEFRFGEEAYYAIRKLIGEVDLIVLDSLANMLSKEEAVRDDAKQRLGNEARMNEVEWRRIVNGTLEQDGFGKIKGQQSVKLGDTQTAVVVINQVRANIGVSYGPKESRKGGKIIDHVSSMIIRVDKLGTAKERDEWGGTLRQKTRLRCERNNFGPSLRECTLWLNAKEHRFEMMDASFIVNLGVSKNLLEKRGPWIYLLEDENIKFQGTDSFVEYLETPEGADLKEQIIGTIEVEVEPYEKTDTEEEGLVI